MEKLLVSSDYKVSMLTHSAEITAMKSRYSESREKGICACVLQSTYSVRESRRRSVE